MRHLGIPILAFFGAAALFGAVGAGGAGGALAQSGGPAGETSSSDLDGLEFLAGEWMHTGTIARESFGGKAGAFAGPVVCDWGAYRTWLVCDHWTDKLAGLGRYAVHVVIRAGAGGALQGVVVNPYGSAVYEGELEAPGRLVFHGGRTQMQRVVYELLADGRIRFTVEASSDGGETFVPHTDGMWERPADGGVTLDERR